MNKFIDYYRVLQVHSEADEKMIDYAYRHMCKQYHPDINHSSEDLELMKQINEAYAVLGNKKKRVEYDREWRKHNSGKDISEIMSDIDYRVELSSAVINEFFRDMVCEDWESAYQKLTDEDKKNVSFEDFQEWKTGVAKLHKLESYKIKYEKRFTNCEYNGFVFDEIMQFVVDMSIMEISTGQISHEKTKKYIAIKKNSRRICLGYSDLKPVIAKFNYLTLLKARKYQSDRVSILNYYELLEQAQKELARSRRYGNPMTLVVLNIKPKPSDMIVSEEGYLERCMSYVSKELGETIRKTDILGRYHESAFAIILTETAIAKGSVVMEKLVKKCRRPKNLNYSIYAASTDCKSDAPMEDILKATLKKASPDKIKSELSYFL